MLGNMIVLNIVNTLLYLAGSATRFTGRQEINYLLSGKHCNNEFFKKDLSTKSPFFGTNFNNWGGSYLKFYEAKFL